MKRKLVLGMGVLMLMSASMGSAEDLQRYENKKARLKMQYPAGWVKDESLPDTLVAFGAPKEKANPELVENVTLTVQDLEPDFETLEKYTKAYEDQLKKDPSGVQVLESKKTTLAGKPAHRMVCSGKHGSIDVQFLQVWTVKDKKAYFITYGAPKTTYSNFFSEAQAIIDSLKFT